MATSMMLAMIEEEILKQSSNLLRICISLLYGANTNKDYEIAHLQQKVLKSPSPSLKGSKSLFFGREELELLSHLVDGLVFRSFSQSHDVFVTCQFCLWSLYTIYSQPAVTQSIATAWNSSFNALDCMFFAIQLCLPSCQVRASENKPTFQKQASSEHKGLLGSNAKPSKDKK